MIAVTKGLLGGLETAVASAAKKDGTTPPFADTFQQVSAKQANQATKVVAQSLNKAGRVASGKKAGGAPVAANAAKWANGTEVLAASPGDEVSAGRATGVIRPTGGTDEEATAGSAKQGEDAADVIEEEAVRVANKQGETPAASVVFSGKTEVAQPKIASQEKAAVPTYAPPMEGEVLQHPEVVGQSEKSTEPQGAGFVEKVSGGVSAVGTALAEKGIVATALPLAPGAGQEAYGVAGPAMQAGKERGSLDQVAVVRSSEDAFEGVVARPAADASSPSVQAVAAATVGANEVVAKPPAHGVGDAAQLAGRFQSAKAGVANGSLKAAAASLDQDAPAQTAASAPSTTDQTAAALVASAGPAAAPTAAPADAKIDDSPFVAANVPRERKAPWVEGQAYVAPVNAGTAGVSANGVETGVNARGSSTTGKRSGLSAEGSSKEGMDAVATKIVAGPSESLPTAPMSAALGVQAANVVPASVPAPDKKISASAEEAIPSFATVAGVAPQPAGSKAVEGVATENVSGEPDGPLAPGGFAETISGSTAALVGANLVSAENVDKDAAHASASSSIVAKNGATRGVSGGGTSVGKERKEASTKIATASDAVSSAETRITAADNTLAAVTPHGAKTTPGEHHAAQSSEGQAAVAGSRSGETIAPAIASQSIDTGSPVAAPFVHATTSSAKAEGPVAGTGIEIAASQSGLHDASPALSPMAHTTISATPTVLEVGVPGGTQGWLKIRAEIGEGGVVQASMSASTHAGQDALHRDLPAINAFLESEHVPVTLQVAHGTSASLMSGSDAAKDSGFNPGFSMGQSLGQNAGSSGGSGETAARTFAGAGGNGQNDGQPRDGYGREPGVSEAKAATRTGVAADWSTPAGYGSGAARGGGSWLNVIA